MRGGIDLFIKRVEVVKERVLYHVPHTASAPFLLTLGQSAKDDIIDHGGTLHFLLGRKKEQSRHHQVASRRDQPEGVKVTQAELELPLC